MREVVRDELGPVPTLTQMEVDSGRGLSHHLLEEEEKKKAGEGEEARHWIFTSKKVNWEEPYGLEKWEKPAIKTMNNDVEM